MQRPFKNLIKGILLLACTLLAMPARAGFATYSDTWPNNAEIVNERIKPDPTIAPAPECERRKAVCATDTYGADNLVCNKGRLYVKLGMNYLTTKYSNMRNISSGAFAGLSLVNDSTKTSNYSWEIGAGTTLMMLRTELEYVYTKETLYNSTPVTNGRPEGLQSTVKNVSVLLNFFYDFNTFQYFKPYVGALWGVSYNTTRSTLVGGTLGNNTAQNSNYLSPLAWGFTFGGRIPFYERWRGYVQYRYSNLGRIAWHAAGGLQLKGYYILSGISLGVQYIF